MNSAPSSSEAFARLHPSVQRWVWDAGWDKLRTVQERALGPIVRGDDVVVSASTASGKTEAAWLPICSMLASEDRAPGPSSVRALYLSPLKALINDQHSRLESLATAVDTAVNRRHGDVAGRERRSVETDPDGILLITPEALEAMFVLRGTHVPRTFAHLRCVVIDEMHSFIGTERGIQLQSLLHRIEVAIGRTVPRIGLSATLADYGSSRAFLRPANPESVTVVEGSEGDSSDLLLQVRGYVDRGDGQDVDPHVNSPSHTMSQRAIAEHLFRNLRGTNNLVFANSRSTVEAMSDLLAQMSDDERVPLEFFPHHGNLAKGLREQLEERLKAGVDPTTAICTSTLEMGIDIGSVESVAQVGPPFSVAALRQRLGRSGRRGRSAVLRGYVSERDLDVRAHVTDRLRTGLVQMVAVVELMLDRWYEPPNTSALHLSTLVQQILSVIAEKGGASASTLYRLLCVTGPFPHVDQAAFVAVLRSLGERDVLVQAGDGTLLGGVVGERIVNHYSFYTAFQVSEEYRIVAAGSVLGSIPVDYPLLIDSLLVFAGRRWRVVAVDAESKTVEVASAAGGKAPRFSGSGGDVDGGIRAKMRDLYESDRVPRYLDSSSAELLAEGRAAYRAAGLSDVALARSENDTTIVIWSGSKVINTISAVLTSLRIENVVEGPTITCPRLLADDLLSLIGEMLEYSPPDPVELALRVPDKGVGKHDPLLSDELQAAGYAAARLDVPAAWDVLRAVGRLEVPSGITEPDCYDGRRRLHDDVAAGFAVIDLETTGFSPAQGDRIIEIAVIQLDPNGEEQTRWSSLIAPGRPISAAHVHRLSDEDLKDAPEFADVAAHVANLLVGRVVVAHNARFDVRFLTHEFAAIGMPRSPWHVVCTRDAFRAVGLAESATLQSAAEALGIPRVLNSHRALADAIVAADVFRRLAASGASVEPTSIM